MNDSVFETFFREVSLEKSIKFSHLINFSRAYRYTAAVNNTAQGSPLWK